MPTNSQIQCAVNAAELVATPLKRDDAPVAITNKELLTLVAAAKELAELRNDDRIRPGGR